MSVATLSDRKMRARSSATQMVLQKTDRILIGRPLEVKVIENPQSPAPAYTDGNTIWIMRDMPPVREWMNKGITPEGMTVISGLNYHELAHCMFMPRLESNLVRRIKDADAFQAFNILQDQTDETKFVALYDPAKPYFISLVTRYMMKNSDYVQQNYPLVAGRLFIPKHIREMFREEFSNPAILDDIDQLTKRYKLLQYPDDQDEMYKVIVEYQKLIDDSADSLNGRNDLTHKYVQKGGVDQQRQKQALQQLQEDESEDDEEDQQTSGGSEEQEGDREEGADPEESESSDGTDPQEGSPEEDQDPQGLDIDKELESAYEDSIREVYQEVSDRIESVRAQQSRATIEEKSAPINKYPASPELLKTVDRCIEEFREQDQKTHPGWHIRQTQGKLNHREYARALRGSEDVYKRWHEGVHDALDFEVVFLLDASSSMVGRIREACESLWVLRRTFDELDGVTSSVSFSSETEVFSQRHERADRKMVDYTKPRGLTYVSESLGYASMMLDTSSKEMRLCVIVTDGEFTDGYAATEQIEEFNWPICIVGIQYEVENYARFNRVIHAETIKQPTELVEVVKNLALRLSDDRINRRG